MPPRGMCGAASSTALLVACTDKPRLSGVGLARPPGFNNDLRRWSPPQDRDGTGLLITLTEPPSLTDQRAISGITRPGAGTRSTTSQNRNQALVHLTVARSSPHCRSSSLSCPGPGRKVWARIRASRATWFNGRPPASLKGRGRPILAQNNEDASYSNVTSSSAAYVAGSACWAHRYPVLSPNSARSRTRVTSSVRRLNRRVALHRVAPHAWSLVLDQERASLRHAQRTSTEDHGASDGDQHLYGPGVHSLASSALDKLTGAETRSTTNQHRIRNQAFASHRRPQLASLSHKPRLPRSRPQSLGTHQGSKGHLVQWKTSSQSEGPGRPIPAQNNEDASYSNATSSSEA
ncbi:hypothetical protein J2808_003421 [Pseudarthrobacter sulfonivorans]|nr:hypothetical protein [Pseudarthrobacter sulfonivorans]